MRQLTHRNDYFLSPEPLIFKDSRLFPPFSSLLANPIPQTNQSDCLPSFLLSMAAPTLSFVLCRDLHFQKPCINLSFTPPSINPPSTLPLAPHTPFMECNRSIQPLLLIITQFHSGGGLCMSASILGQAKGI